MIETEELLTLIPHRSKMKLISRVIDYNIDESIRAEYDVTKDCLFYDPVVNGVPAWAGFEFMAQAISALSGIRDRERNKKSRFGFLLSIMSMQIYIPVFKPGSTLDIQMKECDCMDQIFTFDGIINVDNKKAMEGKMMIMDVNDEQFELITKEQPKEHK